MPRRPSVTVKHRPDRDRWRVRWREQGRQAEAWYETEEAALDAADAVRTRLRRGLAGVPHTVRVGELALHWWNHYVTTPAITESTRETYRLDLRRIVDRIGALNAPVLSRADIRRFRDDVARDHGPRSANKAITALSSMYTRGMDEDPPLVEHNPCRGVKRLPEQAEEVVFPTKLQVDYLAATSPSIRETQMLTLATRAGLRQGELLAFPWEGFSGESVFVKQATERGRVIRLSTKTSVSRRIPIPDRTRMILEWTRPAGATGLLFPSSADHTRPLDRSAWRQRTWYKWRRSAAWMAAAKGEPEDVWAGLLAMKWRHMRHHYASRIAAAGATLQQCSRYMGASVKTIEKHYWFLFTEDESSLMQAID